MNPGALDNFTAFEKACIDCGLPYSSADMALCRSMWKLRDPDQRRLAVEGLYKRRECGEYSDPAYLPLPQNYLGKNLWERPLRVKRNGSATTRDKVWGKQVAPEQDQETASLIAWAEEHNYPLADGKQLQAAQEAYRRQK